MFPLIRRRQKKQFGTTYYFCTEREYTLSAETSEAQLANIMKDYAYNMKKMDGEDYKEGTIKTMWNQTAKSLQEKYLNDFDIKINPFSDAAFKTARGARDAKRKALQSIPEKRRASAAALEEKDWDAMTTFKAEQRNDGETTGRIEYNRIQQDHKVVIKLSDSKLVENREILTSPVRLFQKLREKRDANIKSDRLFLTKNPFYGTKSSRRARWYKDSSQNTYQWVKGSCNSRLQSSEIGPGAADNQNNWHANSNSIKPYLQLDQEHHELIVKKKLRRSEPTAENAINSINLMPSTSSGTITD
ncbi:hypothetical protein NQ317_011232 [Molorchus minor]|uniref:Uncharacterized protein n=1 Tax=Molorchus minor TaxID=1323400 RepID=A0ABQ9JH80_9CUCU|nr:hypothetical protein NQ317_011232 [Molorchus minor]